MKRVTLGGVLKTLAGNLPVALIVFVNFVWWHGTPEPERWIAAFEVASAVAGAQLAWLAMQRETLNRVLLGANLYLLAGGAAAALQQWWFLSIYQSLQETGVLLTMALVGGVTTFADRCGYVGVQVAMPGTVRAASLWLLVATLAAVMASVPLRGNPLWAAALPIIGLTLLQKYLAHRLVRADRAYATA